MVKIIDLRKDKRRALKITILVKLLCLFIISGLLYLDYRLVDYYNGDSKKVKVKITDKFTEEGSGYKEYYIHYRYENFKEQAKKKKKSSYENAKIGGYQWYTLDRQEREVVDWWYPVIVILSFPTMIFFLVGLFSYVCSEDYIRNRDRDSRMKKLDKKYNNNLKTFNYDEYFG